MTPATVPAVIVATWPRVVCCWCTPPHVMREGTEPVSHSCCREAYEKLVHLDTTS